MNCGRWSTFCSSGTTIFLAFLIIGWGFSSSSLKQWFLGSNASWPGTLDKAKSAGSGSKFTWMSLLPSPPPAPTKVRWSLSTCTWSQTNIRGLLLQGSPALTTRDQQMSVSLSSRSVWDRSRSYIAGWLGGAPRSECRRYWLQATNFIGQLVMTVANYQNNNHVFS